MTFYFQIEQGSVVIVEKAFFDKHGHLNDDNDSINAVLPTGFYEQTDAVYETDGKTDDEIRTCLLGLGFIEKPNLVEV